MPDDTNVSVRERFEEDVTQCQECGGEIDFTEAGRYWKTSDERFWHDECYDLIERIEAVVDDLESLVGLTVGGNLVTERLQETLQESHESLYQSLSEERLMKDQELSVYSTDTERGGDRP